MKGWRSLLMVCAIAFVFLSGGCATLQPPGAAGPRAADYPPIYEIDDARRTSTSAAIGRLIPSSADNSAGGPVLSPATLTVESLASGNRQPAYLPKLGTAAVMSEEETRESLRRFIQDWRDLIGADPAKLSLIERVDRADGVKIAIYEQRPFRYPIRGGFGKLEIRFTADRKLVNISSSCIPDADRLQTALAAIAVKLKPEDAVNQIVNGAITPKGAASGQQTLKLAASQLQPKELVTFVRRSSADGNTLEVRIAWEMEVSGAPVKRVYVDAVSGDIIESE